MKRYRVAVATAGFGVVDRVYQANNRTEARERAYQAVKNQNPFAVIYGAMVEEK